jgi:hypothetical protein
MRYLAFAVVGLTVGCGSVLQGPDGGAGGTTGTGGSGGTGGRPCVSNGVTYPSGTGLPSTGCGGCYCYDGQIACTTIACPIDAGTCGFDTSYRYGDTGGFTAYEDVATLQPPASYTYERSSRITDPASSACAPALPPCGTLDLYDPADLMHAVADPDVQAALAMPTPPIYGRDARPVDGTIFQFLRADGRGFLAGGACGSGGPLPGACIEVPAGITRLVNALRALDEQQLADPTCAALRR